MTDTKPLSRPLCALCGEPMQPGEEMFKYHGSLGPCPKPPLPKKPPATVPRLSKEALELLKDMHEAMDPEDDVDEKTALGALLDWYDAATP